MIESGQAVIHVIDDDAAMRTALSRLLRSAGFEARVYASAGEFLVSALDSCPGCILLDLELGGPSGLELQQALLRGSRALPIIFMSAYADVPRTVQALKAGAVDFLVKPFERQALFDAIDAALTTCVTQTPVRHPASVQLADREQVVLRGIAAGLRNKQIAAQLGLSERTIKSCRADLMRKVGATSLAELLRRTESIVTLSA